MSVTFIERNVGSKMVSENTNLLLSLRDMPSVIIDADGCVIATNKHAEDLFDNISLYKGASFSSLLDDSSSMIFHSHLNNIKGDKTQRSSDELLLNAPKQPISIEFQKVDTQRTILWIETPQSAESDSENHDNMKSAIVDASLDALVTIDTEDRIVEFSRSSEALFGWRRDEVLGKCMADVLVPSSFREAHRKGMAIFKDTGKGPLLGKRVEVPAMNHEGNEIPIELALVPLKLNGQVFVTAFMRDISERLENQKRLEEEKKRAEEASLAKSRFLSHMSHELRSPLNALLGTLDIIEDASPGESALKFLRVAKTSGDHLLSVINEILDFSKIESGHVEVNASLFSVNDLVSDVLAIADRNKKDDVILAGYVSPLLGDEIFFDRTKLRQILLILIDNALKFTEQGAVTVSIDAGRVEGAPRLNVEVRDTGVGIEDAMQDAVFAEFEQVDATRDSGYGGTGLGLAIARKLVELLNGSISLSSRVGKGTVFSIELPIQEITQQELPSSSIKNVVVWTKQPVLGDIVSDMLGRVGVEVNSASSFQEFNAYRANNGNKKVALLVDCAISMANAAELYKDNEAVKVILVSNDVPSFMSKQGSHVSIPVTSRSLFRALCKKSDQLNEEAAPSQHKVTNTSVLLVEDSLANRLVARALLEKNGYVVVEANDGVEALDKLEQSRFDVILMDMRMPRKNGMDTIKEIRARKDDIAKIPVIALTANAEKAEIQRCHDAGFDAFISKPFKIDGLINTIDGLVHTSSYSRAPELS